MRRAIAVIFLFLSMLSSVFSYSISPLNQSCLPDQMFALLQLKHEQQSCFHTHDDTPFESWKNNTDCCSWMGVTCDSLTGHVIGLDLNSFGLCGSIHSTSALFHLTHLQSLILFNNSIGGSISSGFNRLSNLRNLNLSWNSFESSALDGIDRLFNLTHLDLSGNQFSGQIHANGSLFHLRHLQMLNLSYNYFEGSVLDGIDRLFNLTHLDLSGNQFSGQIHANSSLFHLLDLQMLDFSDNNFEGSIPHGFHRLFKLTHLDLSWNQFDGQIPSDFSRLTKLVSLNVSYNKGLKLKNPNLKTLIQNLSNLTVLRLSWVNMSSDDNHDWSQVVSSMLPNLEWLSLSNCSISKPVDASLVNLHSLSTLELSSNNLSSTMPDLLGKLPSLRGLGLSSTELYGEIPRNLFQLQPHLELLDLSYNYLLSGYFPEFPHANSLQGLRLDSSPLCGKLPNSVRNLKLLEFLSCRNCSLSGPIPSILSSFENLTNLFELDLSYNSLTGQIPSFSKDKFPNLSSLYLDNNFLRGPIPSSFANLTKLEYLDLSYNNLSGQIHSFFKDAFSNLVSVSLRNNLLEGPIHSSLLSIPSLQIIDLSHNQLNGILDDGDHDDDLSQNSKPIGKIPISSACNGTNLEVLDLSYNKLSGVIPNKCFGHMIGNISVLYLEQNNLHGPIPAAFTKGCRLQMLKLNGNQLQGNLPKSMVNCIDLEELDLGSNQLSGTFPFWLQSLSQLRVLILRSNKFYGTILPKSKAGDSPCFSMLQVFDISVNNFTGKLPLDYISQWKSMLAANASRLGAYLYLQNVSSGHDIIEIVSKGIPLEMKMIFSTFTTINLSHNKFEGNISATIGALKALMELNLSANVLIGQIPASFAQLIRLESLDLSKNGLSGEIPQQMASLTTLSVLDLSKNNLTGMIPQGPQFGTFSPASYEGNVGLCGFPLPKRCGPVIEISLPPVALTLEKEEDYTIGLLDWRFMIAGYCSGVIIGAVIGHTMFWRIVGCFKLTSRMQKYKPKQRPMKIRSHGRIK